MRNISLNIIDCTLRDGGYYNNWEFSKPLVEEYLKAISLVNIEFAEIGFRSAENKKFRGPTWHTTDNYIRSLKIPKNIKLGVMINASEVIAFKKGFLAGINKMFSPKKITNLHFVRVASHFEELETSIKICEVLKKMGYFVCLNMMQISEYDKNQLILISKKIDKSTIDVLYIADSLGSLNKNKLKGIINLILENCKKKLGIHAHDNLSLALENTLYAKDLGANWLDSTVLGMGRGPGNVKTENLIYEIYHGDIYPLLKLIHDHFLSLKKKYEWGTNIYYYLAAKYSIHPTYIQELLKIYKNPKEIIKVINTLRKVGGQRYNVNLIKSEFQKPIKFIKGKWFPSRSIRNKTVLIIAPGKILSEYKIEITNFIKNNKPIVIALSPNIDFEKKFINFYVACNPLKMFSETKLYQKLNAPLILPFSLFQDNYKKKLKSLKYLDYGVAINKTKFIFKPSGAYVPKLFNLLYALSVSVSGKSKNIFFAGFDGSNYSSERIKEIDELLYLYSCSKGSVPIYSITPTPYSLKSKSIFSLVYE